MVHLSFSISLRALVFVLLLGIVVFTGSDVAHSAPSAAELTGDGLLMTNPGQNGARDVHTDSSATGGNNLGGVRVYAGNTLTNPPTTAALQFYGNGHTVFPGQAFIDSGSTAGAAIIFRTAVSGGVGERMRVTANGNVGIGTNDPQEQLHLTGNLRLPATTASTGIIRSGPHTLLHTFGYSNFFAGLNAGNLTMTGSANTATGVFALAANTTGNQNTAMGLNALTANMTGNNNTALGISAGDFNLTGSNNTFIGKSADAFDGDLTNATAIGANAIVGASNSLVLGGTGGDAVSVGIGTTAPIAKLEVKDGNIRVTNGSFVDDGTTLNVPDYVFEPGYALRSFNDLRAFIDANSHLPNIPSRDEVRQDGLNVSQFQMSLLEKVEELTLYALAQHDQATALAAENAALREQLALQQAAYQSELADVQARLVAIEQRLNGGAVPMLAAR